MSTGRGPPLPADLMAHLARCSAPERQAFVQQLGARVGNREVARLIAGEAGRRRPDHLSMPPGRRMVQRMIPGNEVTPHDDPTSQEMRIQIEAAMKLLKRRDLSPTVRMELVLAIRNARWALDQYRHSIGTRRDGAHVTPMMATTTTNPVGAVWVGLLALATSLVVSLGPPGARRPPPAVEQMADALRRLVEPVKEIELREEPEPEPDPQPTKDPFPAPEPDPEQRRRRKRKCTKTWGPPAGGDTTHDEYARHVAEKKGDPGFATLNYFVVDNELGVDFDHYHAEANEYFEAKTRHEILMREWARNQPVVVARILEQASRQFEILVRCAAPGWHLIWYFDDVGVAEAAKGYLQPFGIEVRHEPSPGGQRSEGGPRP